nr:MAG TPA: ATP-dependent Clp protease ATP-binding subunit [Caudoviricetes sp.]
MGWLWDYCAFCGKRIETGEMCYGLPNGESVCTDCCVAENEGVAVSNGDEEQEDNNGYIKMADIEKALRGEYKMVNSAE